MNSVFGVGFEVVALRLKCTNGLIVPKTVSRLSFRHFENNHINELPELIRARMGSLEPTVSIWKDWLKIHPSEDRIKQYFEEVKMGERLQKELLPKAVEDSVNEGVWGVYNCITKYITHDIKVRGDGQNKALSQRSKEHDLLTKFYTFSWSNN
jgi:hypothetical protein